MRKIHYLILKCLRWSLKNPIKIVGVTSLFFILALNQSQKLKILLSIDDLIDPDFYIYASLQNLSEAFGDRNQIFLSIDTISNEPLTDRNTLCQIQSWIHRQTESNPHILNIRSSFGVRKVISTNDSFQMPSLFDIDCIYENNLDSDKALQAHKKIQQSPWANILSNSNFNAFTVSIALRDDNLNTMFGSFRPESVQELMDSFQTEIENKNPKIRGTWGGSATFQFYLRKAFSQTQALNGFMFIIAVFFFWVFFRSWKTGIFFSLTILLTLILSHGLMGALHYPIDVLTNALGLMLMISTLEDFIFISYAVHVKGYSWRKSFRKFIVPSFYTSLTTVIGFGSLALVDLGIVRRFGVISSLAALLEWISVFLLLPAYLKLFPKLTRTTTLSQIRFYQSLKWWTKVRTPRFAVFSLIGLALGSLLFLSHLHVEDSPESLFSKSHIVQRNSDFFNSTRHWRAEVSLLFHHPENESVNRQIIEKLKKSQQSLQIESPFDVVDYLKEGLNKPDGELSERFWRDSIYSKRLIAEDKTTRAQLFIPSTELQQIGNLISEIKHICPKKECELVGSLVSYYEFGTRILKTLFESLAYSLVLVLLILVFVGKNLNKLVLFKAILSALWGPMALLALFIIFKIPIFYVTSVCVSVLVGLAGDNTIQFIFAAQNKKNLTEGVRELQIPSLLVSIGIIFLSVLFFGSEIAPMHRLGLLMIVGTILTYIGDVWILKGLTNDQ